MQSRIKTLETYKELTDMLNIKNRVIIVDVFAPWCGPCVQLGKMLHQWIDNEDKFTSIVFVKINADNDDFSEFMEQHKVSGIPRILGFKNNEIVLDITGFNPNKLNDSLNLIE